MSSADLGFGLLVQFSEDLVLPATTEHDWKLVLASFQLVHRAVAAIIGSLLVMAVLSTYNLVRFVCYLCDKVQGFIFLWNYNAQASMYDFCS